LTLRAWAENATFVDAQRSITELAKARLQAAGIEVSPPQRMVQMASQASSAGAEPAQ
jgi:hypothetical protein